MSIHSENVRVSGSKPAGSFSSFKNEKGQNDLPRTIFVNEVFKENASNEPTLHEAKIYEILRKKPHPALGTCLGCVVSDDGLITGLELVRYEKTLFQRAHDPAFYENDTRVKTMKTVKEAICHLHNLGLAHNDLSPLNIMFVWGSSDEPVALDFDTCHPEGAKLTQGGIVMNWEGASSKHSDMPSFECCHSGTVLSRMALETATGFEAMN
ncbi:hypothetical protein D7B24_004887 [Verticillium nonalfalfae]|uniref:Protein kinase domain-containing protein n=1 Tax=Verticillium nonalfalfae TaxID=1051616 RepID=A0A3M9YF93_9PEZI|nr:uncharacterized protein D7B24_004887 [Verticillium nonalfalfae]RNJ58248.1 hypothetical protein D7B24_004887 [Verticillium nonalfalfae]